VIILIPTIVVPTPIVLPVNVITTIAHPIVSPGTITAVVPIAPPDITTAAARAQPIAIHHAIVLRAGSVVSLDVAVYQVQAVSPLSHVFPDPRAFRK
jgi:hypothetical protein